MSESPSLQPTFRAFVVGAVGAAAIGSGVPYCHMVLHGSAIASYFNTPAAIILFFFLALFGNAILGLLHRTWMLSRAELGLIYIMWIVATAIPEYGFTAFLLPDITGVVYYATTENNWHELLLPHIPQWIMPFREFAEVQDFYEGAPVGQDVPWGAWLPALIYWLSFITSVYLAMISITVILRRQWVERERLVYPLVQLPISMIHNDDGLPSIISPLFKNPLMWVGFAIPAILQTVNGLHHYFPSIPTFSLYGFSIPLFRDSVHIPLNLSFQMLGFSYFISREIGFGLCFFFLLNTLEQGVLNVMGVQEFDPLLGNYSAYTGPIVVHQGFGAVIMLVLFGLWTARGHLRQVFRKAFGRGPEVDQIVDSDEILSYRAAVLLLLGSLTFVGVWLWQSGLPAWITPVYLFFAFVLFIGITRIVAEGGLAFIFAPMIASDFVTAGFGTRALGASGIMAFAFTYIWASDILTFVMASSANALKLAGETIKKGVRLIFWAMLVAIVVSLITSVWAVIELAYRYGGANAHVFFLGSAQLPFSIAAARMDLIEGPHWQNWGYTAIGATIMGLLMFARQRFSWWPIHPLGFPTSAVFGTMFFSVFLAWLIKTVVIKYGGSQLYMRSRPFFLGLILGQFVTAGVWYVIDYVVGGSHNSVMGF
jgi:hypothetical protein